MHMHAINSQVHTSQWRRQGGANSQVHTSQWRRQGGAAAPPQCFSECSFRFVQIR